MQIPRRRLDPRGARRATALRGLLLVLLLLLGVSLVLPSGSPAPFAGGTAWADDAPPTPEEEERLEAIEYHTKRGWDAFRSGNHEEVLARMDRIERYDPESPVPPYLRARVKARTGKWEEALALVTAGAVTHPEDRRLMGFRFELLETLGRRDELEAAARAAIAERPEDVIARTALGRLLLDRGERDAALEQFDVVIDGFSGSRPPPTDLPWVAKAAIGATWASVATGGGLLQDAADLLGRYIEQNPEDQDARLIRADVFQQLRGSRSQSRALKFNREVLNDNPEVPEARVGIARSLLLQWQQSRAIQELERALRTNPAHPAALALLAHIHVGNGDYEKAEKLIARAHAVDENHKETRAVEAALRYIVGDRDAYAALRDRALAYDPMDGRFFVEVADLVGERQRRYDRAAELAQRAVETDPDDPLAYTVLGEALMNLGRTDEARETFEKGATKARGLADVKRGNWLEVLGYIDHFRTIETEHFIIRMHASEAPVMRHYLPELLEASWDVLTEKYGFEPKAPVFADSFHRRDDFSVRSVGVAGLPALGVCFGGVITLLGPTATRLGEFSWARTAWHEFAHVVTLQLSEGQVPRWLTEGLSVYEEQARRDDWGREMQKQLFDRYHNDRLLRMGDINSAFQGPDILFAYFQGGLIADHLTETRGFQVIPEMLKEFAKDRTTAEVFDEVLSIELAEFDAQFKEHVEGIVGSYRMVPTWDQKSMDAFQRRVAEDASDVDAWTRLGWGHLQRGRTIDAGAALAKARALDADLPEVVLLEGRLAANNGRADIAEAAYRRFLDLGGDDLNVRLFLAQVELGKGNAPLAIEHLEAAKACFPLYTGEDSPYLQLARLYGGAGEPERAVAELEAYAAIAAENYAVRKDIKAYYKGKGNHERIADLSDQMILISPYGANPREPADFDLHRDYAEALLALDRKEEAVRELTVQLELLGQLEEPERVGEGAVKTHVQLGRLHMDAGRALDALEQAVAALRLAPEDADALMLKVRAQEAAGLR